MPSSPQSLTFPRDGVVLEPSPSTDTFIAPPGLPGQEAHGPSVLTLQSPEQQTDKEKGELSSKDADELWEVAPENPRNWTFGKKWRMVVVVGLYTLIAPLGSSMMAPGLPELAETFGITNNTILALTLSIFVLAFALAPLVLAPISELYGRQWVLHIGNLVFIGFTVACAYAPSVGSLIAFRFLAGAFGSAPLACGGGVVSDLFTPNDRAMAMAIYSVGPLLGPVIGVSIVNVFSLYCVLIDFSQSLEALLLKRLASNGSLLLPPQLEVSSPSSVFLFFGKHTIQCSACDLPGNFPVVAPLLQPVAKRSISYG
ncbi:hypothetical protein HGRIS_010556 [Hohenbuehelia grisea]|uniref:Major facilitator superfamily (MFS) profile domain-containing protein n=1 Tax=Hohenbuehelia grisea TaxID=104357 RepID=A0ABR3IX83_9AGAR